MSSDMITKVKELRDTGMSLRTIAAELGVSPGKVSGLMSRNRDIFPITDRSKQVCRQKAPKPVTVEASRNVEIAFHEPKKATGGYEIKSSAFAKIVNEIKTAEKQLFGEETEMSEWSRVTRIQIEFDKAKQNTIPQKPINAHEAKSYDMARLQCAKPLSELDNGCCKWSVTDNPKGVPNLMCAEVMAGKNYCSAHENRAWRAL